MRWLTGSSFVFPIVLLAMAACGTDSGITTNLDGTTDGTCDNSVCAAECRAAGHSGGTCWAGECVCTGGGDGTTDGEVDIAGRTLMTGTVWSPGRVVPISGALVYFGLAEPAPIPPGAYPETCEDPPSIFFTESAPDGTFELYVTPGDYYLVVHKGQFRRVRNITVPEGGGPVSIDAELTTLPNDYGAGDTIPHMALAWALEGGDHIEDVLAKLSMGTVGPDNTLELGTQVFDIYNIAPYPDVNALYNDLDLMLSYHIIFFPCTIWPGSATLADPVGPLANEYVRENIRAFVAAGGKLYATDMMYDVFEQPMPEYVDICGDDATPNDGDHEAWAHSETMGGWTSHGYSVDPDLSAWLDAIGVGSTGIEFMQNFVWVEDLLKFPDPPPIDPFPPHVWVEGDFILEPGRTMPLTITYPYQAGKVLFSTYHTVGDTGGSGHAEIYPQEYVLLYLIMEIGVCTETII